VITPADAMEVLTLIAACHHRTAPRLDDEATARATATVWAELLNAHRLDKADALAAVKRRAATNPVAPEPAEVIAVAREIRRDRDARTGPTTPTRRCASRRPRTRRNWPRTGNG